MDAEKVQTLLDALRGLTAKEFTSDEQADQAKFDLGAPTIEVEVRVGEDGTEKVLLTDPAAEQVYGAIASQPSTYELEKGDAESLRNGIADVIAEEEEATDGEESPPEL